MSNGRRFGAPGMRRALRESLDGGAAAAAVTLNDIYARHTWQWWWDGSNGVDVGADTWTDRVSSKVLSPTDCALSVVGVNGVNAVRLQGSDTTGILQTPASLAFGPHRIFAIIKQPSVALGNDVNPIAILQAANNIIIVGRDLGYGWHSRASAGADTSERVASNVDNDDPHVLRAECNATHASHVYRVDGVAGTSGPNTGDPGMTVVADAQLTLGYSEGIASDVTFVVLAMCTYGAIDATQAAQVETDLLTIMGL